MGLQSPCSGTRLEAQVKIDSLRIQNFRTIKDQTVPLTDYTCLVGPNGAGKSTILTALNVLFRYSSDATTNLLVLDEEDFHQKNTEHPIVITATFTELSADAQADFANYYRQGKLIISSVARWDERSRTAPVMQFGERTGMVEFKPFFKAEGDGAKVDELKKIYIGLKSAYSSLPSPGTKQFMIDALRQYEEAHPGECKPIPSEDQFYGFGAKGKNLIEKYLQWIFVPAVKDASTEQLEAKRTAFGQILERTVRSKMSFTEPIQHLRDEVFKKYGELLASYEKNLEELASALTARLQDWAHPDARIKLSWQNDSSKVSIADPIAQVLAAEGVFEGHLPRFGHGFQRSFLLALLQELASTEVGGGPTLVLACEEPELYQHPPQIRHLASVFADLAGKGSQVLVCTHNPIFVRGEQFEEVRFVTKNRGSGEAEVRFLNFDAVAESIATAGGKKPLKPAGTALKVAQALQPVLNEMFFTTVLVLVEGLEDASYIATYLVLNDLWKEFRRLGGHIVPCQGKNSMIIPLAIARGLKIPTFIVFDADTDKCGSEDKKLQHEKDNKALLSLCGLTDKPSLPDETFWNDGVVMWKADIGSALASDFGKEEWDKLSHANKKKHGIVDVKDVNKCGAFIQLHLAELWDGNKKSPTLDRLCRAVVTFAHTQTR
jgi:putative ATP-dependent endonuclease of OLD family